MRNNPPKCVLDKFPILGGAISTEILDCVTDDFIITLIWLLRNPIFNHIWVEAVFLIKDEFDNVYGHKR